MKKLLKGCLLASLFIGQSASAVEWGPWTTIKVIYITTSGTPFVTLESLPGCYNEQGAFLQGSDIDRAYATLLAAYMAKKRIKALYTINEGATGWSMCTISSFYIQD